MATPLTTRDRRGLEMSGSTAAALLYDRAISHLLRFQPEVVAVSEEAMSKEPDAAMPRLLRAYVGVLSSERPDALASASILADTRFGNDRERAHGRALEAWVAGDIHTAGRTLDAIVAEHPRDVLALAAGHQIDFFTGDAVNLRDRVARVRGAYDPQDPESAFLDGMLAFGLEECGDYARAEEAGQRAVTTNRDDPWGIHAVTHVHEMQGSVEKGVRFLDERRKDWLEGTFMNVHNAWHLALFHLEREEFKEALGIYDGVIHHSKSAGVAMEMLDGSALLWRLYLDGVDTGGRFAPLAEAWAAKDPEPWYVFNDHHAIMAFVGAGRQKEAEERVALLESFAASDGAAARANLVMVRAAGLAAARALAARGRGDHARVVAELAPVRRHLAIFGGSHAQRDAYQRTLLDSAIKAGERALASQLLAERLTVRPDSVWALGLRSAFRRSGGDDAGAAQDLAARDKARDAHRRARPSAAIGG